MCNRCLGQCTKSEIEQPEVDELWALFRAAYEQYQLEIVNDKKLYKRFVNDFVSYHLPYFGQDEHLTRMHIRNLSNVYELLTERFDLIEKYFDKDSFVYEDYVVMVKEFNTIEHVFDHSKQMAWFNDEQIRLLLNYINDVEEIFVEDITESELKGFFACNLEKPLVAKRLSWFLMLLNALAHDKFLVRGWQKLIAGNGLLMSNKSNKPVTKTAISSNIARMRAPLNQNGTELDPFKSLTYKLKLYVE